MRSRLARISAVSLTIAALLAGRSAFAEDTVMLKNGGRVRGTIMSETPTDGVKIKLLDGTVQVVASGDVDRVIYDDGKGASSPAPVGPPATSSAPSKIDTSSSPLKKGRLIVSTTVAGKVFIDGAERGPSPVDISAIDEGTHLLRVDFSEGGSTTTRVSVVPDGVSQITVEPSEGASAFANRRGFHLGVSAEEMVAAVKTVAIGSRFGAFANLGGSPGFDFRVGPQAFFGIGRDTWVADSKFSWSLGAAAQVRFNAGSIYTLWLGINGGVWSVSSRNLDIETATGSGYTAAIAVCPFFMAEASPLTFRFGEYREFEVGYTAGIGDVIAPHGGDPTFESLVTFNYILPAF